jgi:hypothetical protein
MTVAKDVRIAGENEDRWGCTHDGTICAISDGASVSFDSRRWADILVRHFMHDPLVTAEWLKRATAEYNEAHDRDTMRWMMQAAFDRGSAATLAGVVISQAEQTAEIAVYGDSLAVWADGARFLGSFPYTDPDEFDQSPRLLSTVPEENDFLNEAGARPFHHTVLFDAARCPVIMLMTDALGRWLLERRCRADAVETLISLENDSFLPFVVNERLSGSLKRDDTTLLAVVLP